MRGQDDRVRLEAMALAGLHRATSRSNVRSIGELSTTAWLSAPSRQPPSTSIQVITLTAGCCCSSSQSRAVASPFRTSISRSSASTHWCRGARISASIAAAAIRASAAAVAPKAEHVFLLGCGSRGRHPAGHVGIEHSAFVLKRCRITFEVDDPRDWWPSALIRCRHHMICHSDVIPVSAPVAACPLRCNVEGGSMAATCPIGTTARWKAQSPGLTSAGIADRVPALISPFMTQCACCWWRG